MTAVTVILNGCPALCTLLRETSLGVPVPIAGLSSAVSVAGLVPAVVREACVTLSSSADGRIAKLSLEQITTGGDARVTRTRTSRKALLSNGNGSAGKNTFERPPVIAAELMVWITVLLVGQRF